MKRTLLLICLCLFLFNARSQKYFTKNGMISFYSSTPVEDIEATNRSVAVVLDSGAGDVQFALLMKGFQFKKALMQEHFNEDYVESDKYPKAEFKGQITNNSEIKYSTDGNYTATVSGQLTIHGQTQTISITGTMSVKDGKLELKSVFNVLIADYKITVPRIYRDNISSSIRITVNCQLVQI